MATRVESTARPPYGVGSFTAGWYVFLALLLAVTAIGVYAYAVQYVEGEVVTGMRDIGTGRGSPWGLYIPLEVYFIGLSFGGIALVAVQRLGNLGHLAPISRIALLLAVIGPVLGALSVLADLGQPLRALINLPLFGRPMSPFFGTFTIVIVGYLSASLVYLYLNGLRDAALLAKKPGALQAFYRLWAAGYKDTESGRERIRRALHGLSLAAIPLLLVGQSTSGLVFGLQAGRPGWFSALQAPAFVVLAAVSGVGMVIVIAALLRGLLGARSELSLPVFRTLGNFLLVLTGAYLYFATVEVLTSAYAAQSPEARISAALLTGPYSGLFWLSVAMLAVPFLALLVQYVSNRYSLALIAVAGIMVNIAAIGKRYLIVLPSQTHGSLLPYGEGSYTPTLVEYGVVLGLLAMGILAFVAFVKVFPIFELPKGNEGGS